MQRSNDVVLDTGQQRMSQLAAERVTGELVVVGWDVECRIYFEHGRLAWASSSRSKHAFTRYLQSECGVERQSIADAVAECRRSRRPIGELLVEWGIVDERQVRDALEAQVIGALRDVRALPAESQALFIPRRAEVGDFQRITFDAVQMWARANDDTRSDRSAETKETGMAKLNMAQLGEIDGYMASAIVDSESGMVMGEHGVAPFPLELAAAGNTEVVRAKRKTMRALGLNDNIEDILITLGGQYHVIRPLEASGAVFIYVVLDRAKTNLAMARHVIRSFEKSITL